MSRDTSTIFNIYQTLVEGTSRRDFLKKIGGAAISAAGGDTIGQAANAISSASKAVATFIPQRYQIEDAFNLLPTLFNIPDDEIGHAKVVRLLKSGRFNYDFLKSVILGGDYYATIMPELHRAAREAGQRLFGIQGEDLSNNASSEFNVAIDNSLEDAFQDDLPYWDPYSSDSPDSIKADLNETYADLINLIKPGDFYLGEELILSYNDAIKRGLFNTVDMFKASVTDFVENKVDYESVYDVIEKYAAEFGYEDMDNDDEYDDEDSDINFDTDVNNNTYNQGLGHRRDSAWYESTNIIYET